MNVGSQIIDEIIKQGMFSVGYPDPSESHVFVWSSGAAEQLEALVHNSAEVQIPRREAALYASVLQILGAPDAGHPQELINWANSKSKTT